MTFKQARRVIGDNIVSAQAGDTSALNEMWNATRFIVMATLARMIDNQDDREDVAQLVMLKLVRNFPRFRRDAQFSTYAYKAAFSEGATYHNTRKRVNALRQDIPDDFDWDHLPDQSIRVENPTDLEDQQHTMQCLHSILQRLPEVQRNIFLLRADGWEYSDIARKLGKPIGTVKSNLNRSHTMLREHPEFDPRIIALPPERN